MDQEQQLLRRRRRGLLRMYYGVDEEAQSNKQEDMVNINSIHFKADQYLEQLYKTCDLQHLKTEKEKTKSGIVAKMNDRYFVCVFLFQLYYYQESCYYPKARNF